VTRSELEHAIRAACDVADDTERVVGFREKDREFVRVVLAERGRSAGRGQPQHEANGLAGVAWNNRSARHSFGRGRHRTGARIVLSGHELDVTNETLEWAHDLLGLDWAEVAGALGADRRTIYRWRRGLSAPSVEHRERIHELRELRVLLEIVLGDDDGLEWLRESVPAFGGDTPRALIRRGQLGEVIGVLAAVESGAFA
jgi:transcriptional regulator with XRE-family HTH domain